MFVDIWGHGVWSVSSFSMIFPHNLNRIIKHKHKNVTAKVKVNIGVLSVETTGFNRAGHALLENGCSQRFPGVTQ